METPSTQPLHDNETLLPPLSLSLPLQRAGQALFAREKLLAGWVPEYHSASDHEAVNYQRTLAYPRTVVSEEDKRAYRSHIKRVLEKLGCRNYQWAEEGNNLRITINAAVFDACIRLRIDADTLDVADYAEVEPRSADNFQQQNLKRQEIWKQALFPAVHGVWQEDKETQTYQFTGRLPYADHPALRTTFAPDVRALFKSIDCPVEVDASDSSIRVPSAAMKDIVEPLMHAGKLQSNLHVLAIRDGRATRADRER